MPDPRSTEPYRHRSNGIPVLSPRELMALRQLAAGRSTAQIAAAMDVSPNTVRARIHHLRAKLDVESRQQVVPRARELGLIDTPPPQGSAPRPVAGVVGPRDEPSVPLQLGGGQDDCALPR
jgi:DNA-binding CsgD family transcriptional regulator